MLAITPEEVKTKEERVAALLQEKGLEGVCLFKFASFAWFTCGGSNRVVTGSERGCASILLLGDKKYLIVPQNEANRILTEEVAGQGFEPVVYPWYESPLGVIHRLTAGRKVGSDWPVPGLENIGDDLDRLRFSLTPAEMERARWLAGVCADETAGVCASLRPGMTEWEIAAALSRRLLVHGVRPAVLLVGVDGRAASHRHPVPRGERLQKFALISLVGEKWGLHATLTRCVHFGPLPGELREKHDKVCYVDARMIESTVAGTPVDRVFDACKDAYAQVGYPGEWELHHQGGATGYAPREYRAGERQELVQANQLFGWNPTLQGTKSEDTILVRPQGMPEIITPVPAWWPVKRLYLKSGSIERPLILEV